MTISEKVAYLKGLSDGLGLDTEASKESKLLKVVVEILEEIGLSLEDLEETAAAMGEDIDALSDDLADVEDFLFEEDDDDDDDDLYDDDDDFFEVDCPSCEENLVIDAAVLEKGSIQCPNCGKEFALDLSGGCDCDCEGHED